MQHIFWTIEIMPIFFREYQTFSQEELNELKVSRSQNMNQKIYEIITSPKIQKNSVILDNCIDYVCLCFDRLLLLDFSAVQVLHTQYVSTFQDRKTNLHSFSFWEKFRPDNFVSRSTDLQNYQHFLPLRPQCAALLWPSSVVVCMTLPYY